jgi:hypothetical protein
MKPTVLCTKGQRREKLKFALIEQCSNLKRTAAYYFVRPTPNAGNGLAVIVVGVNHRNQICSKGQRREMIKFALFEQCSNLNRTAAYFFVSAPSESWHFL